MPRYFIEVTYAGTRYSGFQVQKNSNTIQAEINRALQIYFNKNFELTGSSRTDSGVHAFQNFFHFDTVDKVRERVIYNLNALLPYDIVVKNIFEVKQDAHCRFDAVSRTYHYKITRVKNPFYFERAFYYPYATETALLEEMAGIIQQYGNFESFSKKKTQVKTFNCNIELSRWVFEGTNWRYEIKANRFLRGMVKGLTGTMLRLAKNKKGSSELIKIIEQKDQSATDFSVPSHGLYLMAVEFSNRIFLV